MDRGRANKPFTRPILKLPNYEDYIFFAASEADAAAPLAASAAPEAAAAAPEAAPDAATTALEAAEAAPEAAAAASVATAAALEAASVAVPAASSAFLWQPARANEVAVIAIINAAFFINNPSYAFWRSPQSELLFNDHDNQSSIIGSR